MGRQDYETETLIAQTLTSGGTGARGHLDPVNTTLLPVAFDCKRGGESGEVSPTLRSMSHDGSHANAGGQVAVAFDTTQITAPICRSQPAEGKPCHTLSSQAHPPAIFGSMAVRRLTPRECERLQGFPDDYTKISDKTADGPRYKALGNSMAVPVMRWIGERIQMAEAA
jgi:DNA (cytosine-5)-methyltransferase 1